MFLLKSSTHRMLMTYDERLGHRYVAGLRARVPHSNGAFFVQTNADGFRSNIDFVSRRGGTPRILAFGDSFTAGDGCENDVRYPEVAARILGAEVYNFGVSGTAPDQHVLMLETFVRRFEPDLIVWGIPIHNIERIGLRHRLSVDPWTGFEVLVPKPYFECDAHGSLSLHHVPVPRQRPEFRGDPTSYADQSYSVPRVERWFKHPLFEPLRRGFDGHLRDLKQRIRSLIYRGFRMQLYDAYEDSGHPAWRLLAQLARRFAALADPVPVLITILPTYHYVVDRLKPIYRARFESLARSTERLHVHDTTSILSGRPWRERLRVTFPDDGHYSAYGHRLVGEDLAHAIHAAKLLPNTNRAACPASVASPVQTRVTLAICLDPAAPAAAVACDGKALAALAEAHLSRTAVQEDYPRRAINFCLEQAGTPDSSIDTVVLTPDPISTLQRVLLACAYQARATELDAAALVAHVVDWVRALLIVAPQAVRDLRTGDRVRRYEAPMIAAPTSEPRTLGSIDAAALDAGISRALAAAVAAGAPSTDAAPAESRLGPSYSSREIEAYLDAFALVDSTEVSDAPASIANLLRSGSSVAWFAGRLPTRMSCIEGRTIFRIRDHSQEPPPTDFEPAQRFQTEPTAMGGEIRRLGGIADATLELQETPFADLSGLLVATPADAYRAFQSRGIDALVFEHRLLRRTNRTPSFRPSTPPGATIPSRRAQKSAKQLLETLASSPTSYTADPIEDTMPHDSGVREIRFESRSLRHASLRLAHEVTLDSIAEPCRSRTRRLLVRLVSDLLRVGPL